MLLADFKPQWAAQSQRIRLVDSKRDFHKAFDKIEAYAAQRYTDEWGVKQYARLGLDVETYRPDGNRAKFPVAVWDGEAWEVETRTIQIGLDPLRSDLAINDMQFVFDMHSISKDYFAAAFKPILEESRIIMHRAAYEWSIFDCLFDIQMKHSIDTMLTSQLLRAGYRESHSLGDCYSIFLRKFGALFYRLTGKTFKQYIDWKKGLQKLDWSGPLTRTRVVYGSHDVWLPFYLFQAEMEAMQEWIKTREKNFPPNKSIERVLQLEFALIPVFAMMETRGVKIDQQYHQQVVIPQLEQKRDELIPKFRQWPAFRMRRPEGVRSLTYRCNELHQSKPIAEVSKEVKKNIRGNIKDIASLSVKSSKNKAGDRILITWANDVSKLQVHECVTYVTGEDFERVRDDIINLKSVKMLQKALKKTLGLKAAPNKISTRAKRLKRLYDPDDPRTECIKYILRYKKAADYASKYGRGLYEHVNKRGYAIPAWHQMGSDRNEIASGRSSASGFAVMQMPSRDFLFAYDGNEGIEAAELFRSMIVAPPGCEFVNADKSQIEPRMQTVISKAPKLIKLFREDGDVHLMTAASCLQKTEEETTKDERNKIGKKMNLALSYQMGPGLAAENIADDTDGEIRLSKKEAQRMIDNYYSEVPELKAAIDRTCEKLTRKIYRAGGLAEFKNKKIISVVFAQDGRPRTFTLTREQEEMEDEELALDYNPEGERFYYNECKRRIGQIGRQGWNHRIQASCASAMKWAELFIDRAVHKYLKKHPKYNRHVHGIVLVLHDEVLVCVPKGTGEAVKQIVIDCMRRAAEMFIPPKLIPVKINAKVGPNWYLASPK